MKRLLLLVTVLVCISSLAMAQPRPGSIGIFVDQLATDCNVVDASPGLKAIYILHVGTSGSLGSRWKMDTGAGVTMAYVGETSPFQTIIGNSQSGISIVYQSCYSNQFLLLTVNYFATGTSTACSLLSIVPDPATDSGSVEITGCGAVPPLFYLPKGGQARVNPDGTCMCNVSTQESSWGSIKSLYK